MCIGISWRLIIKCNNCGRDYLCWGIDITWKQEQTRFHVIFAERCSFCRSTDIRRMTSKELEDFFNPKKLL